MNGSNKIPFMRKVLKQMSLSVNTGMNKKKGSLNFSNHFETGQEGDIEWIEVDEQAFGQNT